MSAVVIIKNWLLQNLMFKTLPGGKASVAPNSQPSSPVQKFHLSSAGDRQPQPPKHLRFIALAIPLFLSGNSMWDCAGMRAQVKCYPPVKIHWVARAAFCGDFILLVLSCSTIAPGSCFLQTFSLRIVTVGMTLLNLWCHLTFQYFIWKWSMSIIKKNAFKKIYILQSSWVLNFCHTT